MCSKEFRDLLLVWESPGEMELSDLVAYFLKSPMTIYSVHSLTTAITMTQVTITPSGSHSALPVGPGPQSSSLPTSHSILHFQPNLLLEWQTWLCHQVILNPPKVPMYLVINMILKQAGKVSKRVSVPRQHDNVKLISEAGV
jgi:hypothetical protein